VRIAASSPDLALGTYTHPAGGTTLTLNVGIGSGAYRGPFDFFPVSIWDFIVNVARHRTNPVADAVWMVSDRGPNFQCEEAPLVIGLDDDVACPAEGDVEAGTGRIYPRPDYSPSIFRVHLLRDGTVGINGQVTRIDLVKGVLD